MANAATLTGIVPSTTAPEPASAPPSTTVAPGTGTVDWALAERVAIRVAGREPFSQSYHYDSLAPDSPGSALLVSTVMTPPSGIAFRALRTRFMTAAST